MITLVSSFNINLIDKPFSYLLKNILHINKYKIIHNQILQELSIDSSSLFNNKNSINILLLRLSDLVDMKNLDKFVQLRSNIDFLSNKIEIVSKSSIYPLIIVICPNKSNNGKTKKFLKKEENYFIKKLEPIKNLYIINHEVIHGFYFTKKIHDPISDKYGKIPYTLEYYSAISLVLARYIYQFIKKPHKVIILDCDNTLWNGIVSEDGVDGISITEDHLFFQKFIVDQCNKGTLICLCSKNNENDVLKVFSHRKEMLINLNDHIISYKINWERKSESVNQISKELNLSVDSFVFIDDSPEECAEINKYIPEILTICLPKKIKNFKIFLKSCWVFDHLEVSEIDKSRLHLYRQQSKRTEIKKKSSSFNEFIKELDLKVSINKIKYNEIPRVSQLTNRVNQFNLNPKKLTYNEILNLLDSGKNILSVSAKDRFGSYGLVGILIYEAREDYVEIIGFLLSCRALSKHIEYKMVEKVAKLAKKRNLLLIKCHFYKTKKNIPAQIFVNKLIKCYEAEVLNNEVLISVEKMFSLDFNSIEYSTNDIEKSSSKNNYPDFNPYMENINSMIELSSGLALIKKIQTKKYNIELKSSDYIKDRLIKISRSLDCTPKEFSSSFVEAGLDSIAAVRFCSLVYEYFNIEIGYEELLYFDSSIIKLTKIIKDSMRKNTHKKNIFHKKKSNRAFISSYQRDLCLDGLMKETLQFNSMSVAIELKGEVDIAIIKNSIRNVVLKNKILSSRFFFDKEKMVREEIDEERFVINEIDLSNFKKEIKVLFNNFCNFDIDLRFSSLIKCSIVKINSSHLVLLLKVHHTICDAISMNVILKEISNLYNKAKRKDSCNDIKNTENYNEFIEWLNKKIKLNYKKSLFFWKEVLKNFEPLKIPYDHSNLDSEGSHSNRIYFSLSRISSIKLIEASKFKKITLYSFVLSIYVLFLSKFYGENKDISILVPISVREHYSFSNTIGMFVNLNLLRFKVNDNLLFVDYLKGISKTLSSSRRHQYFPFGDLVSKLKIPKDKNNIFPVAGFVFQNHGNIDLDLCNVSSKLIYPDQDGLIYDTYNHCRFSNLTMYMKRVGNSIKCVVEYNKLLFNESSIYCLIDRFKIFIDNLLNNYDTAIRNISILRKNEFKAMIRLAQGPGGSYPQGFSLINYFKEQVKKNSKKIAIRHHYKKVTYHELDKQSDTLAYMIKRNFDLYSGGKIAICINKGINQIVAILSVLKLSCIYVPIDMNYFLYQIKNIIATSKVQLILTDNNSLEKIKDLNIEEEKFCIDSVGDCSNYLLNSAKCLMPQSSLLPAYILFTSGSTGAPKGVVIEQKSIVRLVKNPNYIKIKCSDIIAQVSSIAFDAATFELWGAILNGSTLVIYNHDELLDGEHFRTCLKKDMISILWLSVDIFSYYAKHNPLIFSSLRYLLIGGDVVNPKAVALLKNYSFYNNSLKIINGYGPTENTTFTTTHLIEDRDVSGAVPIGKPIKDTNVYIVSDSGNFELAPVGVIGRIYISGLGLMKEYVNSNSNIHEVKITKNPFQSLLTINKAFHKWLYDTGDYGRWRQDGVIEFFGRKDNQLKIRGFRINVNYIEHTLLSYPDILKVTVLVRGSILGDKQLVAYYSTCSGNKLSDIEIFEFCKRMLPSYMCPHYFIYTINFKLTANGKIDKKYLLDLFENYRNFNSIKNHLSITKNEKILLDIFKEILDISNVNFNIYSDFFMLGGDSLSALKLIKRIRDFFNVRIPVETLFSKSSIAELAKFVSSLQHGKTLYDSNNGKISSIVCIRRGDDNQIPIIFVHPIGGTLFCYQKLIDSIDEKYSCYGIQDPSIQLKKVVFNNVGEIAKYYAEQLVSTLPNRPYILCGYSFGGMVALEMGKLLNNYTSYVFLFDTWLVSMMDLKQKNMLKDFILDQYEKFKKTLTNSSLLNSDLWLRMYYHRMQNLGFDFIPSKLTELDPNVVLFKAKKLLQGFDNINNETNYIQNCCVKKIDIYSIDANHDTILNQESAATMAEVINNKLNLIKVDAKILPI